MVQKIGRLVAGRQRSCQLQSILPSQPFRLLPGDRARLASLSLRLPFASNPMNPLQGGRLPFVWSFLTTLPDLVTESTRGCYPVVWNSTLRASVTRFEASRISRE